MLHGDAKMCMLMKQIFAKCFCFCESVLAVHSHFCCVFMFL